MDDTILELAKLCMSECQKIIIKIAHLKQLDKDEMVKYVLPKDIYFNEIVNEVFLKQKKKTNKRNLPCGERCLGRKMDFSQCTRKRKDNTEFCGSHIKNRPNGKIGDDGSCFHRKKGKRGRKRKVDPEVGKNEILTTKFYHNGSLHLKDKHNIVYTYNQDFPVILGRYDEENKNIVPLDEANVNTKVNSKVNSKSTINSKCHDNHGNCHKNKTVMGEKESASKVKKIISA